jgi:RNA polymerase sigma-70 factor (ECF subfamily)
MRVVRPQTIPLEAQEEDMLLELEHPAPGPEEVVGLQESFGEITQVIAALPEHYRAVLNLYYYEQFSYQEIADLLHQPVGTVKSKVSRGLGLVRAKLAEQRL